MKKDGKLTTKVRQKPYSVILFDEIEKAHPDIMNMLLQILEDGILTDNQGITVDFKNTVIIMTSNIGARLITDRKQLGFSKNIESDINNKIKLNIDDEENITIKKEVMKELKKELRPEFINRIDEIVVFNKLSNVELEIIIKNMLNEITQKLKNKNINIEIDNIVIEKIIKQNTDISFGARPLRKIIHDIIENSLVEEILEGKIIKNKKYKIGLLNNDINEKIVIR